MTQLPPFLPPVYYQKILLHQLGTLWLPVFGFNTVKFFYAGTVRNGLRYICVCVCVFVRARVCVCVYVLGVVRGGRGWKCLSTTCHFCRRKPCIMCHGAGGTALRSRREGVCSLHFVKFALKRRETGRPSRRAWACVRVPIVHNCDIMDSLQWT